MHPGLPNQPWEQVKKEAIGPYNLERVDAHPEQVLNNGFAGAWKGHPCTLPLVVFSSDPASTGSTPVNCVGSPELGGAANGEGEN